MLHVLPVCNKHKLLYITPYNINRFLFFITSHVHLKPYLHTGVIKYALQNGSLISTRKYMINIKQNFPNIPNILRAKNCSNSGLPLYLLSDKRQLIIFYHTSLIKVPEISSLQGNSLDLQCIKAGVSTN